MASLPFELVSPERLLVSEPVDSVTAPGIEGEFTVLAGHAPFITILKPGIVTVTGGAASVRRLYVRGGFAEVNPTGLTVLADLAIPLEELDEAQFATEIAAAQTLAANAQDDDARRRAEERLAWIKDIAGAISTHRATAH